MGSLKWKKCLGSLKKAVFALFLIVSPKKGIKKAKNDGQNGTCNWFLPGKAVFFGGGTHPWLGVAHGCTPVATPTPLPRPRPRFCPLEPAAQPWIQCRWRGGLMGLHFSDFFLQSMTLHPTLWPPAHLGKSQCLVKMVSYGITGDVDIDAGSLRCTLAFAMGNRDFSPISCPSVFKLQTELWSSSDSTRPDMTIQ